jgi:leucyl aminopeptidase
MPITFELAKTLPDDIEAVVVPACSDQLGEGVDWDFARARGFEGRVDQVLSLPGAAPGVTVVMVGLGPVDGVDPAAIRRAAATSTKAVARQGAVATHLLDALPPDADASARAAAAQALAEGSVLGTYQFLSFKSKPEPHALERVVVVGGGGKRVQQALEMGAAIGAGVAQARDLVNEPGGSLTPTALAAAAEAIAEREGLRIEVLDEEEIAVRGMGGVLGVNRGSSQPPRFIEIAYEPASPRGHLALVGKGITFDSGGLSLKTAAGMMTMKDDMGGAAAILGMFAAINAVKPRARVTGYIPVTDNMTGPDATRPGDVLTMVNGKTVEVLNTDAEGRLILADALCVATDAKPDAIVDLATLTGAQITALGNRIAGLLGNDDGFVAQVEGAAQRAGERVWRLPLPDDYRRALDSDVADLRNIPRQAEAGTIMAALFLREFVGDGVPWVHLDIAGPAWSDDNDGDRTKGGTGFGVRTLLELAKGFTKPR